jgi:hypothetical protein
MLVDRTVSEKGILVTRFVAMAALCALGLLGVSACPPPKAPPATVWSRSLILS